ncbi:MAG: hypothetical protein GSR85_03960 [Desulfurococcales archaeon]|nr:hypothetical protein [Desulfurococcales archaeon]
MATSDLLDSIDRLFVKLEMLEKALTPILGRNDVKGEAVAIMGWIEEIYDELALLRKRLNEGCNETIIHNQ